MSISLAGLLLLASPYPVAASTKPTWTLQTTVNPSPGPYPQNSLSSISCQGTVCLAVGSYQDAGGAYLPMLQTWNGTTWALQSTPAVTGSTASSFSAVNCTWATACTLVGSWTDSAGNYWPLAERWNGISWTVQAPVLPTGAVSTDLYGISCPRSATGFDCEAIGSYYLGSVSYMLVERWNGATWAVQSIPAPGGSLTSSLSGISCFSPTACFAVGSYQTAPTGYHPLPLIERWNGTSWTAQAGETANSGYLSAVSCPTSAACTAVGYIDSWSKGRPFGGPISEQWNGSV